MGGVSRTLEGSHLALKRTFFEVSIHLVGMLLGESLGFGLCCEDIFFGSSLSFHLCDLLVDLLPDLLVLTVHPVKGLFLPGRGDGRSGCYPVFPLELFGVEQCRDVGFHRLDTTGIELIVSHR